MIPNTVRRQGGNHCAPWSGDRTGLAADSTILTLAGEMCVSEVTPGQRIVTRDSGTAVIKSIRRHTTITAAVRIKAGSLGHTQIDRDAIVPAGQPVFVRDWRARALSGAPQATLSAARLVDGEFVTHLGALCMTLYELEFDAPHVLYVDGLEVLSHGAAETAVLAA